MSEPHICPQCNGVKKVNNIPCPTCDGTGVVWFTKVQDRQVGDSFTKEALCLK